ncbi:MAG: thioesterase [Ferruginibacter sp.]|nr:thioesterase [Ferruginibacter sp.]
MARIRIELPAGKLFTATIPVRITDINYGNHLGNDALVSILHEARMQWLRSGGYTELAIEGIGLIMSDLGIEYKKEGFYGDQLTVNLSLGEQSASSFELFYEVKNQEDALVAKAKTGMICYDYSLKKVTAIPTAFAEFLLGR